MSSLPEPLRDELGRIAAWGLRSLWRAIAARQAGEVEIAGATATEASLVAPSLPPPPWLRTSPPWEGKVPPWTRQQPPGMGQADNHSSERPAPLPAASYAEEIPATACLLCTSRHLRAMREAAARAREALDRGDAREVQAQVLRLAGEAEVMRQFDWEPTKLRSSDARTVQAVRAVEPHVLRAVHVLEKSLPPRDVVLSWAACDEALRFARSSNKTPRDLEEISRRTDTAQNAIAAADESLGPHRIAGDRQGAANRALDLMRQARHEITSRGDLERATQILHEAGMQLTAVPRAEEIDAALAATSEALVAFRRATIARNPVREG